MERGADCRLAYDPADATATRSICILGVMVNDQLSAADHVNSLLPLASVKSRLVLPFWYRLTWVVPEKGPLKCVACWRVKIA